jgi:NADH-quinone oxidoreductase subunit M
MLAWTIYISFAAAALVLLVPPRFMTLARWLALVAAVSGLGISLAALIANPTGAPVTLAQLRWIPSIGAQYSLSADGISFSLCALTGLAATAGVLFSWNIEYRVNEFFALFLALIGGVYGVFLANDLLLLFVFYEIAIVPKYFLISIWGSTNREYGAMKLAIYSFVGSAMVLFGILSTYMLTSGLGFGLPELAQHSLPHHLQMWVFPLVFLGFGILAGIWPFHTWAPTGHVAAPTAASMLLAGVVMKLGAYGCLRVAMGLYPAALDPWGFHIFWIDSWRDVFAVLAVIGIIYGAAVALVQRDFKFVIGYSSVSHMGFVIFGLMTLTRIGLDGAVLQMVSHGILAGLLFAVVGRMIYERTHTRILSDLEGMGLASKLPFATVVFVLAGMASMGLPGFSGFVAELQILVGGWNSYPWMTVAVGVGIVIGVAYTWRVMQRAFFGVPVESIDQHHAEHEFSPITWPEKVGSLLLLSATLFIGLFPSFLLSRIATAFASPFFDGLRQGRW